MTTDESVKLSNDEGRKLRDAINACLSATSTDPSRLALNSLELDPAKYVPGLDGEHPGTVRITSTDGCRIHSVKAGVPTPAGMGRFYLHRDDAKAFARALPRRAARISLTRTATGTLVLSTSKATVEAMPQTVEYPDWRSTVLPDGVAEGRLLLSDPAAAVAALRDLSRANIGKRPGVRLEWSDADTAARIHFELEEKSGVSVTASATLPGDLKAEPWNAIGVNPDYLADALEAVLACEPRGIAIEQRDPKGPLWIGSRKGAGEYCGQDSFALVMPFDMN